MTTRSEDSADYVLGHADRELDRLSAQAQFFEPFTRQFLQEAGLRPGMRVLDVGCGSGDVAFLAAEAVGPAGEVVGVDTAPEAVARATGRAQARGLAHVAFSQGDATGMAFDRPFDAIIGRLVLMYLPDPAAALRRLARHLAPGGLVAFQEFDMYGVRSLPPAPLMERCVGWIRGAFERVGAETRMGLRLYPAFVAAGLPAPTMRLDAGIGGGPDLLAYRQIAEVIRTLLPLLERLGIATAAEIDIGTLADRLRDEVVAGGGVVVSPSLIGAWARL